MGDKSCCWSVTINNPTGDDETNWNNLRTYAWVREVTGQMEKGSEGTLHIQGMVKTQSVRFAQMKKVLPRAHIEAAKNPAALAKYVTKPETRVASIPTVRTATQADIQRAVYYFVIQDCYRLEERRLKEAFDILKCDEQYLLNKYAQEIRKHWESYVDEAVRSLIVAGYYGIEYVMSNPQVRTAFRKYIVEICYRHGTKAAAEAEATSRQEDASRVYEGGGDSADSEHQS